jgi:hypothetical protein
MLNLPIGSRVAASYATCVAPKSLPSFAYFVHWPLLPRYSRLSAFSIRMFMRIQHVQPGRQRLGVPPSGGPDRLKPGHQSLVHAPESFANVFRRVADPVEPFGFLLVKNELSPPLLTGIGERSGKQPGLFDQVNEGQTNELQRVHGVVSSCRTQAVSGRFQDKFNQNRLPFLEAQRSGTLL